MPFSSHAYDVSAKHERAISGPQKNNGPDCPGPFEISFGTEVVRASVWPFLPILRLVPGADSG